MLMLRDIGVEFTTNTMKLVLVHMKDLAVRPQPSGVSCC